MLTVYDLARRYVAKIPPAVSGSGGHNQTFSVATALIKGFDLTVEQARPILAEYNQRCEPPWSVPELEHKLVSADGVPDAQPRGWLRLQDVVDGAPLPPRSPPPKPEPKPQFRNDKLTEFAARWRQYVDTAWLADRSPVATFDVTAAAFLQTLYRPGEHVVIFTTLRSQGQALWPNETIPESGREGVWILSQPVDGKTYPNPRNIDVKTGKPIPSRRSEESVTSWRYMVVESDKANARDWMGALVQLPLAIAAIYTSGGRSIHALVRVNAPSKHEWDSIAKAMKPILVTLGADGKSLSAVRQTRLPGCWREGKIDEETGKYVRFPQPVLQKLLYLNPDPRPQPICKMERRRDCVGALGKMVAPWLANTADIVERAGAKTLDEAIAALDKHELEKAGGLPAQCLRGLEWLKSSSAAQALLDRVRSATEKHVA